MDILNNVKYYKGFEGEPEIIFQFKDNKDISIHIWEGYIDDIISKSENLKGEMIILIEGAIKQENENELNNLSLEEHYEYYQKQGLDKKDIIKNIAKDRGVNKNEIYMNFVNKK